METIPKENCTKIGFIQKTHGISGEMILKFQEEFYETLEEQPTLLFEIEGLLVPYYIAEEQLRLRSGESAILKLDWIDDDKQAKTLCGCAVFVKNEDLLITEEELSLHALVGYLLFDQNHLEIGSIVDVEDYSGNVLLAVKYKGKEVLVPFNEDLLLELDEQNQTLTLSIPDGLFDLEE